MAQKTNTKVDTVAVLVEAKLTHHLEMAEEHLIEAVKLFEREYKPQRHHDYITRLIRAQEMVTGLFREELIRIRGPIKVTAKVAKGKK